jgi:crotonobetainyl-CoA:carnitine CoA-transferase CaiB-like acyl-CoA transferase
MSVSGSWPLAGLRVIDLSSEIAGPYASKLFADAGADVIKLEHPDGGDPLRRWTASGAAIPEGDDGALFQYLNASKRSVAADLTTAEGRALVLDLAASADLLIESLGPGELERRGLSFEALRHGNRALSLVSISHWGATGPWARRPATEWTLQAAIGLTGRRGLPERGPVGVGGRVGEWVAGSYAATGALAAWLSARSTGVGQHVDLSIFEAMLMSLTQYHDLDGQFFEGPLSQYLDNPSIEPAKDGWVGFATVTGQQWRDFCALIGRPDVGEDERFHDANARMPHLAFIHGIIHAWTRERTVDEIVERATLMRIPAAPIGDGRTLPRMDHFVARGVFVENPGGFLQPRPPYRLAKAPLRPVGAAPKLGQHDREVRAELGSARPRAPLGQGGPALPFAGLRVIDLTAFWAGPFATALLAALGADVLKIESIQRPDGMRFANAVRNQEMWEWSPIFHGANLGKRGVTLRLDREPGLALLKRLVAEADVLIESFSVRVMENFGLSWELLRAWNPRLVWLRIPAWGLDGPWRDRPGFAMNVEQVSGLAWNSGYTDLPMVVNVCDPLGGLHAVFALAMALEHRRRTDEGQLVEVPLVEPGLNIAAEQVIEYSAYGELLARSGNRGPAAAPQGVYACSGSRQYLALAVANDRQWRALRGLLGDPAWARAAALESAAGRRTAHDLIDEQLRTWLAERERGPVLAALLAAGVPASPVINAHDVMPNPQLEHRRFYQLLKHPRTGEMRYPGLPMRFSALGPDWHRRPAPTLGQHNDEILGGELDLGDDELARLRAEEIIGDRPAFL